MTLTPVSLKLTKLSMVDFNWMCYIEVLLALAIKLKFQCTFSFRKEQLQEALQKKKEGNAKALQIVESFIDNVPTEDEFLSKVSALLVV
jgi:hypothetical protein